MRRYVEWIIRHRALVIGVTVLFTSGLIAQIKNLHVVIDPDRIFPQSHPYVETTNKVEEVFGAKYVIVIGITPREGDAFQPTVLAKVQRITAALLETPGVVRANLLSFAARRAKNIVGTGEGMEARPLMETVPHTPQAIAALRQAIHTNPAYVNIIVSQDERTAAIAVELKQDHTGFRGMVGKVTAIVDRERDPSVEIAIAGQPVILSQLEKYSQRMGFLFPLALLIIGLIHYEAFRTVQGLILPLVTALLAVIWGLGVMGFSGVPMDMFNATTPILILAVAAGHAVQILKRYYEEYYRLRATTQLTPHAANQQAVVEALTRIGPVMLTAGGVAVLGFLSLLVFSITSIRAFGIFTGLGILSALVLEMTFIPALRSYLPPPGEREQTREREERVWDRITAGIAGWVVGPRRWRIYAGAAALGALWLFGMTQVVIETSSKLYFSKSLPFQQDDLALNARLGGTNTIYVLIDGQETDAIKDPRVLRGMDAMQHFLEQQPHVGKTLSLADFIKRMNKALNGDDPAFDTIPDSRDLISQYLLLYSMSGEPGDFDSYVDYDYRLAKLSVFLKITSSTYLQELITKLNAFSATQFPNTVRIGFGGSLPIAAALNEVMVHSKILNMLQICGVVLLITAVVFRSLSAGVLVLIPLLFAVLGNFGLMGLTGITLNIPTSLISAMAVGMGADYAIYLIFRIREELARGVDEETAFRMAITTAGKAILFVASAVAGGYSVLLLSYGFYIHTWYAILIGSAMLVSSIASLTILPSLLLSFRPAFVFGASRPPLVALSKTTAALFIAMALGLSLFPSRAFGEGLTAQQIMEKNFVATKSIGSTSNATFTLVNKNGQERVRKTFGTTKLQPNGRDNMRMTRFLSPPDVKDTVTLLIEHSGTDDDIWVYLPALKKVRRLVSSNKKDSFVGTDFSYGDVIGHKVEEWEHKLLREEEVDGQACYVIESTPKTDAIKESSGYSKRVGWVRKDNFVTIKGEFWDQAGQPLKTSTASDVRLVDPERDKWQAMRLEAANSQTEHRTIIQFDNFTVKPDIEGNFFTTRYMEQAP
jgi:predicted RND superfamily exporter protein/outer membrane lipoprotein-sorting protein